jgi:hypothetical protein
MANHGDMLPACFCHFGGFFDRRIFRICRIAIARTPPTGMVGTSAISEGCRIRLGGSLPVASP